MQSMTRSQLLQLSPAERVVQQEIRKRAKDLNIDAAYVSHYRVAVKLAVQVLMLQKKLKAAQETTTHYKCKPTDPAKEQVPYGPEVYS